MHLSLEAVKQAARGYYEYGGLAAQSPNPEDRACRYGDQYTQPCAVGAALPMELRVQCDKHVAGLSAPSTKEFRFSDGSSLTWDEGVGELQRLHDSWCAEARDEGQGVSRQRIVNAERKFIAALYA